MGFFVGFNMTKPPAFQFYPADFLSDENVALMSNQEVGCYIKLMCYCWRQKSIPKDIPKIAKLCGESLENMNELWPNIEPCFNVNGSRYFHKRLDMERKKQNEWRKKSAKGGKRSAKNREGLLKGGSSGDSKGGSTLQSSSSFSSSSLDIKKYMDEIDDSAFPKVKKEIMDLAKTLYENKEFPKVHAFINQMIKQKKNPRTILHSLIRCSMKKPPSDKAWGYCTQIIKVEDGNYNERDSAKTA